MLLVSGWMAAFPTSLPFPTVNFSVNISALRSDDTMESFACLLVPSFDQFLSTALQEQAKSEEFMMLTTPRYLSTVDFYSQFAMRKGSKRPNGSALHPGRKSRYGFGGLWEP